MTLVRTLEDASFRRYLHGMHHYAVFHQAEHSTVSATPSPQYPHANGVRNLGF